MTSITIDCDDCRMRSTSACDECLVTFLCDREEGGPVVFDELEGRALRLLGGAGLVPPLRHAGGGAASPAGGSVATRHGTPRRPSRGRPVGSW